MTASQTLPDSERVADWPRITATLRADGTGSLTVNGTERPCTAANADELRTGLIAISFEQLGLQPAVVDSSSAGAKQIRAIYQSAKTVTLTINELRNLQGTGHGRTLPTGVTVEAARYVIRETTHVAELMLTIHDRQMGR
mgnify:CR=1 FL=1